MENQELLEKIQNILNQTSEIGIKVGNALRLFSLKLGDVIKDINFDDLERIGNIVDVLLSKGLIDENTSLDKAFDLIDIMLSEGELLEDQNGEFIIKSE